MTDAGRAEALVRDVWQATAGTDPQPVALRVSGATGLGGPLAVPALAIGAVAAQLLAARRLDGVPGDVPLDLDATHVGLAFRSERHVRLDGVPVDAGFAPLSRFWRTADGWIRLHGNYPRHRAAVHAVLGDDVGAAALDWAARDLETAVVEAGGAAAAVRSVDDWQSSPQGRAVAGLPLLTLRRTADGPPRHRGLAGLRVLDLTRVIAGPVSTRTLASHGADVLRVNAPALPDDPGLVLDTGSGKRSVVLDLASPTGRRTVEDLMAEADVVVQGYRPGALDAFGLDPGSLAERHPHLVVVRLSAWGDAGPWRGRRGFDSLVQAATGISLVCGTADEPGGLPAHALDHGTGHLAAAVAMAALARQRSEGGGWHGELSLAQTGHWLLAAGPGEENAVPTSAPSTGHLLRLPTERGTVTVVAPPGSPPWSAGAAFVAGPPAWR